MRRWHVIWVMVREGSHDRRSGNGNLMRSRKSSCQRWLKLPIRPNIFADVPERR